MKMNNNTYKQLKESTINSEIFLKYKKLNKVKLKSLSISCIAFNSDNFIALTGGDLHEDIFNMPNYKEYIRSSFDQINACFAQDFNLNDPILGPIYFEDNTLGVVILIHKNLQPLKEIQTILNIILYFLAADYIVKFPTLLLECSIKDLGISSLVFFPIPADEDHYLYILKINTIDREPLTFQVGRAMPPKDISNIDFAFNILYHMIPNIMKYSEIKSEPTWLIPNILQYYLMPEKEITDDFEMSFDYIYHKITESIDAAFPELEKKQCLTYI